MKSRPPRDPPKESKLELRFEHQLLAHNFRPMTAKDDWERGYIRNYNPIPGRNFELDFVILPLKIFVEIQGMAHRIKGKFLADAEKRILCTLAGWRGLELTGELVRNGDGIAFFCQLWQQARRAHKEGR